MRTPAGFLAALAVQASLATLAGTPLATAASSSTPEGSKPKEHKSCTVYNPTNGISYDLNTITVEPLKDHKKAHKDDREESWHARGYDYGVNFTMNFCAPVVEHLAEVEGLRNSLVKNVSAFYTVGHRTFSIGQTSTKPIFRGRKLVLNYTGGSPCGDSVGDLQGLGYLQRSTIPSDAVQANRDSSDEDDSRRDDKDDEDDDDDDDNKKDHRKPKSPSSSPSTETRRKSSLISFVCDRDGAAHKAHISFIGASPDECAYFFEARSAAACGGVIAQEQSLSPGGMFGFIALIAAAVYLLGGIAYQRTVMHQRGWRQVPNYSLWAGILGFFKDIIVILFSSCTRCLPRRKGYNQVSGRGRRDDEANGLIDSYDEEY